MNLKSVLIFPEAAFVKLEIELDSDYVVLQNYFEDAIKFGVQLTSHPITTTKYFVAFFQQLLLQREKMCGDLLKNHLRPKVAKMWQEVLCILEDKGRKILSIQNGSVIFKIFCPTVMASREIQDDSWICDLIRKTETLVRTIGRS